MQMLSTNEKFCLLRVACILFQNVNSSNAEGVGAGKAEKTFDQLGDNYPL